MGKTLAKFADSNQKIVAITAAMPSGTGLGFFQAQHPDRYFDVGIAEEHAALFACGLATQGLKPFLTIYSTFMQRAYDMIIHDIALQNLNVALCMDRAGLSGDDGPTHHGLFDIGYLRHVPNIVHMQPKDEDEFVDMLWTMANYDSGPIAIRYPRGAGTGAKPKAIAETARNRQSRGRATRARSGAFSVSATCSRWPRKPRANWRSKASPSRSSIRAGSSRSTPARSSFSRAACEVVCTIEDHVLHNGFGCAVMEHLHTPDDQHPGRADRLARSIRRTRHHPDPAQEARPNGDALVEKVLPLLKRRAEKAHSTAA